MQPRDFLLHTKPLWDPKTSTRQLTARSGSLLDHTSCSGSLYKIVEGPPLFATLTVCRCVAWPTSATQPKHKQTKAASSAKPTTPMSSRHSLTNITIRTYIQSYYIWMHLSSLQNKHVPHPICFLWAPEKAHQTFPNLLFHALTTQGKLHAKVPFGGSWHLVISELENWIAFIEEDKSLIKRRGIWRRHLWRGGVGQRTLKELLVCRSCRVIPPSVNSRGPSYSGLSATRLVALLWYLLAPAPTPGTYPIADATHSYMRCIQFPHTRPGNDGWIWPSLWGPCLFMK